MWWRWHFRGLVAPLQGHMFDEKPTVVPWRKARSACLPRRYLIDKNLLKTTLAVPSVTKWSSGVLVLPNQANEIRYILSTSFLTVALFLLVAVRKCWPKSPSRFSAQGQLLRRLPLTLTQRPSTCSYLAIRSRSQTSASTERNLHRPTQWATPHPPGTPSAADLLGRDISPRNSTPL